MTTGFFRENALPVPPVEAAEATVTILLVGTIFCCCWSCKFSDNVTGDCSPAIFKWTGILFEVWVWCWLTWTAIPDWSKFCKLTMLFPLWLVEVPLCTLAAAAVFNSCTGTGTETTDWLFGGCISCCDWGKKLINQVFSPKKAIFISLTCCRLVGGGPGCCCWDCCLTIWGWGEADGGCLGDVILGEDCVATAEGCCLGDWGIGGRGGGMGCCNC